MLHLCSFFHGGADNILKMDAFLLLDMTDIDMRHLPRDTGVATPLKMITTVHKLGWKNKSSLSIFVKVKIKTAISLLDYGALPMIPDGADRSVEININQ